MHRTEERCFACAGTGKTRPDETCWACLGHGATVTVHVPGEAAGGAGPSGHADSRGGPRSGTRPTFERGVLG